MNTSGAQDDAYVKTTPATLPTVAVPTDRMPGGVNVIPAGSLAPALLTLKAPPRVTPAGKVAARLNVAALPTANEGGLTTHAGEAGGGDAASGGAAAADASCSLTSQPRSISAPAPNPKHKTLRRPASFMHSTFCNGDSTCKTSTGVDAPVPFFGGH